MRWDKESSRWVDEENTNRDSQVKERDSQSDGGNPTSWDKKIKRLGWRWLGPRWWTARRHLVVSWKQVIAGVAQLLKVHRTKNTDQVCYPGKIRRGSETESCQRYCEQVNGLRRRPATTEVCPLGRMQAQSTNLLFCENRRWASTVHPALMQFCWTAKQVKPCEEDFLHAQKERSKRKYTCVPADMYNEWAFQLLERSILASLMEVAHS